MGGRGSSSSSGAAEAATRKRLLEYADSLSESRAFINKERAELARTAADLVGTDTLKAMDNSGFYESVRNIFQRNDLAVNMGVSYRLGSLSGRDRDFVEGLTEKTVRETGATRQQIDAYFAFRSALSPGKR